MKTYILTLLCIILAVYAMAQPPKIKMVISIRPTAKDSLQMRKYKAQGYCLTDAFKYDKVWKLTFQKG